MDLAIEPCRNDEELRRYIDTYWRKDHVLAREPAMFSFQYRTPWVDRTMFPTGTSVLCAYSISGELVGFLGAIVAPYPRPYSLWLALWHVLPETKGTGVGGALLRAMQQHAAGRDGWIGTFGAGAEALPVYLKRGYAVRAVRRWVFDGTLMPTSASDARETTGEIGPPVEWLDYRYENHPAFSYERVGETIVRTEENDWGRVTHVVRPGADWIQTLPTVHSQELGRALDTESLYMLDCWAFECPGTGWSLAPEELPSLFHPPEARGNLTYASGWPFVPVAVGKGDCDQDRPN